MNTISNHPKVYIRPSPSKGILGGLSPSTAASLSLLEAASYNFIFIESVGVGQSESEISQVVDMMILLLNPGAGDGLQGLKKGVLETADMILITKNDGDLQKSALNAAGDYVSVLNFFQKKKHGWGIPPVVLISSFTNYGVESVYEHIKNFYKIMTDNGQLISKRQCQRKYWFWIHVQEEILCRIKEQEGLRQKVETIEKDIESGTISPRTAAWELLKRWSIVSK